MHENQQSTRFFVSSTWGLRSLAWLCLGCGCQWLWVAGAFAQACTEAQPKLIASDGEAFDFLGSAVSISGDTAIVGAPFDADNGGESGSAYIFVYSPTTGTWLEQQKLTASDGAEFDQFGNAVAISGNTAIVGAHRDSTLLEGIGFIGAAYIFVRSPGTGAWSEQQKLVALDWAALDFFGTSVSIDGDIAIVGAIGNDNSNGESSGAAYLFVKSGGTWLQQQKIIASDGFANDNFGRSVSISGTTAIIGVPADEHNGIAGGSAYVFVQSGSSWNQQEKLIASDAAAADNFGASVSISGDSVIVGAPGDDDHGSESGSAYFFIRESGATTWTQQPKNTASDAAANDRFGARVAMSENVAVVGASFNSDNGGASGSAYVFERSVTGGSWSQLQKLTASDAAANDQFGRAVAIDGDRAIIGAQDDVNGVLSGSAYVFECDLNTDTDGDGLLDSWETQGQGMDINHDGIIDLDLYALGARPDHKDLFIEIDYMTGMLPLLLNFVEGAFSNAPVSNPDGSMGINLHLQIDDELPHGTGWTSSVTWQAVDNFKSIFFGTAAERVSPNSANILAAKVKAFRYCVYADTSDGYAAGVARSVWANDFVVFYGMFDLLLEPAVFMHELGHCLGLLHGGGDNINLKPNYISVMNYLHSLPFNAGSAWTLDFSRGTMLPIVENNIDESVMLEDLFGDNTGELTYFSNALCEPNPCDPLTPAQYVARGYTIGHGPKDINGDLQITQGVCADLNYFGTNSPISVGDTPTPCETFNDHNDWANLEYALVPETFPFAEGSRPPTNPPVELTIAEIEALQAFLPGPPCLVDINADDAVNVSDLLAVINAWGECVPPPSMCSADIAPLPVDHVVNVSDLLAVINAWGLCAKVARP